MFRSFLALLLCLLLTLSPALAVQEEVVPEESLPAAEEELPADGQTAVYAARDLLFPRIQTYEAFSDVTTSHWAASCIRLCCETGLMKGQGGGRFSPDTRVTNGEIIMLAARIHAAINGASFEENTSPWYQGAVTYLNAHGVQTGTPRAYATRQGFFSLLSAILPVHMLTPINDITLLPDTSDPVVLSFYNAGILTGVDRYGTFHGSGTLTRAECAAMTARVIDPSLRKYFTPAGQVPALPYAPDTVVLTVNGTPVRFELFSETLISLIDETQALYLNYGLVFSWDGSYGMESWPQFFKEATTHSVAADVLAEAKAQELGCSVEELALVLFGQPTQAELDAYARAHGITPADADEAALLAELVLVEKLSAQLSEWVTAAEIVTTPVYEALDVQELWELSF